MNIWRRIRLKKLSPKSKHGVSSKNIWTGDFYPYKQELYLKITSLNQENLKLEEYVREFEQLQMRVYLKEEPKLKISRSIKGLSLSIANKIKMDLQPYLSFDDVCHLVVKVEKQLNGWKFFQTISIRPQSTPKDYSSTNKVDTTPMPIKTLDKGKGIVSEPPKRLEGKKCFKCHDYGYF